MNRDELRENLAAYAHEAWGGRMKHVFRQCVLYQEHISRDTESDFVIPAWAVEKGARQMNIPYDELSEEEKPSDRLQADKILAIVDEYLQSPLSGDEMQTAKELLYMAFEKAAHPLLTVPGKETCEWKNVDHEETGWDCWETECGEMFHLAGGGPQELNMYFCPYCGRRIEQLGKGV